MDLEESKEDDLLTDKPIVTTPADSWKNVKFLLKPFEPSACS
jgi:hypothetical protein